MSNTEFRFPPPPPPPPRRDVMPGLEPGYGRGSRGGSFNRGSDRGGGSRARGRGFGGRVSRGNSFSNPRGHHSYSSSGPGSTTNSFIGHREWSQGYSNPGASSNKANFSSYGAQQSQVQSGSTPASPNKTNHWNAPQKRDHATAFNHRGRGGSKPPAAPAVPSFLANIPGLSPPIPSNTLSVVPKVAAEKKPEPRTSNMLGLNPSSQGPDSDEDDEDEEAILATTTTTTGFSFEYNGQAATLKTPAEIAAWIADRKKRFPTTAKAEQAKKESKEKQRKWEEEKKANQEARRLQRESYEKEKAAKLQERNRGQNIAGWLNTKEAVQTPGKGTDKGSDATEKARLKTEKLIKKAEKAQKKLTKAQDALRKAQGEISLTVSTKPIAESSVVGDMLARDIAPKTSSEDQPNDLTATLDDSGASSILTSDGEDDEDDDTSSSGSSSNSDSDAAPEALTTKRTAPDRVAPPPRGPASSTQLIPCRNMMKYGQCRAGNRCRFSHDPNLAVKQTGSVKQRESQLNTRPKRKGLWEVMVEKEREEQARKVLRGIVEMGEKGMLGAEDGG